MEAPSPAAKILNDSQIEVVHHQRPIKQHENQLWRNQNKPKNRDALTYATMTQSERNYRTYDVLTFPQVKKAVEKNPGKFSEMQHSHI